MKLFSFAHNTSIRHEVPPKLRNKLSGVYNENPAYKYNFFSCKLRGSNPSFPINLNFPSILRIVKRPLHETYRKYYSLKDFSSPFRNNVKTRARSNSLPSFDKFDKSMSLLYFCENKHEQWLVILKWVFGTFLECLLLAIVFASLKQIPVRVVWCRYLQVSWW